MHGGRLADLKPFRLDDLVWRFRLYTLMGAEEDKMALEFQGHTLNLKLFNYLRPMDADENIPKLWENIYQSAVKLHATMFPWTEVQEFGVKDIPTLVDQWGTAFGGDMRSPEMKAQIEAVGDFLMKSRKRQGR